MDIFKLERIFWQMASVEKFSPTATALYFYLLHKANRQRWRMPVCCPTETFRCHVEATRQSISNARKELCERGLISFTSGTGKGNPPAYILKYITDDLTDNLTDDLTDDLTDSLTLYKNNTENNNNNKRACEISLTELEEKLSGDDGWLESVAAYLSSLGINNMDIDKVKLKISEFFLHQKARGFKMREETECKSHFVNWLIKNNGQNKISQIKYDSTSKENYNRRRGFEVTATSIEDYYTSF